MRNSIRNSEIWDSKIRPLLDAYEEHVEECSEYYEQGIFGHAEFLEIIGEAGQMTCDMIAATRDAS